MLSLDQWFLLIRKILSSFVEIHVDHIHMEFNSDTNANALSKIALYCYESFLHYAEFMEGFQVCDGVVHFIGSLEGFDFLRGLFCSFCLLYVVISSERVFFLGLFLLKTAFCKH